MILLEQQKKHRKRQLFILGTIFIVLINFSANATNYYVSNEGDDASLGTSPESAWQTISKVNSQSFLPGDNILFRRGDTWRNAPIRISSSGNSSNRISFGAYSSGDKPLFLGSIQIISWTHVSGNIWSGDQIIKNNPISIDHGAQIFFNTVGDSIADWGYHKTYQLDNSNLNTDYEWSWNDGVIYIYTSGNPNTTYKNVECPQTRYGVYLSGNSYLSFNNLEIKYLVNGGIYESYGNVGVDGLQVTYCDISNIGTKGGSSCYGLSVTSSNAYYAHNVIHDCGRRAISINLYETTPVGRMHNVIIEHNYFYHGWHTTGVDCINSGNHVIDSVVIRNNIAQGDNNIILGAEPNDNSNSFYISNQTNSDKGVGIIKNIYIYNNIITYSHGKGIALGNVDTAYVVYNTLYGFNTTLANGQALISLGERGNREITVRNNILYNNMFSTSNNGLNTLLVSKPEVSTYSLDYNLYWNEDPVQHVFEFYQAGSYDDEYYMSGWQDYLSDKAPNDANSPVPSNPMFVNAPTDLSLLPSSDAIDAGTPIAWVTTDYLGNPRDPSKPTIGAIEYGGIDSTLSDILTFEIAEQISSTINSDNQTVSVRLPFGVSKISLNPSFTLSFGASSNPVSGADVDFTSPVDYLVSALDGISKTTWTITVLVDQAPEANNKPVVDIVYETSVYKGMVQTIDASSSYDADNESLSFHWIIPTELATSSLNTSSISLLPTIEKVYNIGLNVSDGIDTVYSSFSIGAHDYNPAAYELKVLSIEASDYEDGNYPENILDNNNETRWSSDGDNQWLQFELADESSISHFELSFYSGESRQAFFDIFASVDKETWDLVLENSTSCGFSPDMHAYEVPEIKASEAYKYVKLVGHMNSENTWNSFTEIKIYGHNEKSLSNNKLNIADIVEVYPNPTTENVYVKLENKSIIRVVDLSGAIVYEQDNATDITEINYYFKRGIYFIQVTDSYNNTTTRKLIVK